MRGSKLFGPLSAIACLALAGCGTAISVREISPRKARRAAEAPRRTEAPAGGTFYAFEELGEATRQRLRQHGMVDLWTSYPDLVVRALDRLHRDSPDLARPLGGIEGGNLQVLAAVAELALVEAKRMDLVNPIAARPAYLLAASRAFEYLLAPRDDMDRAFDPVFQRMNEIYRDAVNSYVHMLLSQPDGLRDEFHEVLGETYHVRVERRGDAWDPGFFRELHLASELDVKGFRNHHRHPGLGVPLAGVRSQRGPRLLQAYYPPGGMIFPLTAVLRFDVLDEPRLGQEALFDDFVSSEGQRTAVLSFYNPLQDPTARLAGLDVPLAADTTAPFALQVARANLREIGTAGFHNAEKVADLQGLYMHAPYDPDKIPVIMIHGLRSSPHVWLEMTNDLFGDPEIRKAFQIWHYVYPSGLPYLYNGAILRDDLEELRRLDPAGTHKALRSMVIVAHSMGGLLAKTLITSSGRKIWDSFLTVPPEQQLAGQPEDVERLRKMILFEPLPYVDRVVFISTPHRGSQMAQGFVGRLSGSTIHLPDDYTGLFRRLTEANWDALRPEARKMFARGGPTAVRALSPQSQALRLLAELPIDPAVVTHTIIGDRDSPTGDPDLDSDGVVTHESANLPEAVSELFVPTRHNAYSHPLSILEVRRILKEHLRDRTTD